MELDLKRLLVIARRRWWALLLIPLLCGVLAFSWSQSQTRMYSATATIRINPPALSTDLNAIRLTQDLTETYRQLIVLPPVMERVIADLGLPYDVETLQSSVTATTVRDTQLVRIAVSDADPGMAAEIANSIADHFAVYVAEESQAQIDATLAGLATQVSDLTDRINELGRQISELDTPANRDDEAVQQQIQDLRTERTRLQDQVADLETKGQEASLATAAAQTQVTVSARATPPSSPYAPRIAFSTVLGLFVGILLAIAVVAAIEYLDNTIKDSDDIQQLLSIPVLSSIPTESVPRRGGEQVFVIAKPTSSAAEAIRLLRANLEFALAGQGIKSIVVCSANSGDGKSTVAANIGAVIAQSGTRATLIDADLRKPTQDLVFGAPNDEGLTTLLTHPDRPWQSVATRVATPLLSLVPSGPKPPNPTDLLSIDRFSDILDEIEADSGLVIVDSPPILAVADPLAIARKADAVLLVARSGKTRRDDLRKAFETFSLNQVRILGVVLNQQAVRASGYYYYGNYAEKPTEKRATG